MGDVTDIDAFIAHWRETGGSELANTQSFINGLCHLLGVEAPQGSRVNDDANDYVFERRVFQDNGDGTTSFGRVDCYKRACFILEAKQGSEADRDSAKRGEDDLDLFGQTASTRVKRGTAQSELRNCSSSGRSRCFGPLLLARRCAAGRGYHQSDRGAAP